MNLELENVSAGYGRKCVISGVKLSLPAGRICALMGRNGSGKTTLLRCINAVIPPLKGRIRIMGEDIKNFTRPKIARQISMVPQFSPSAFAFTCMDMVLMAGVSRLKPWQTPGDAQKKKALSVMAEVDIDHLAKKAFNAISGGERQLIMLARALFQETPIMLLDEPNSHLDFTNQHKVMTLMKKVVKKRDMTVLITLHDPNLTHYYCDDVVMIHKGKVAAKGRTTKIMTDRILSQVLGDNIQCDVTRRGVFVVTPKALNTHAA